MCWIRLICFLFATVVLAACSQSAAVDLASADADTEDTEDGSTADIAVEDEVATVIELDGGYFSTSVTRPNGEPRELAGDVTLRIGFSGNRIRHSGGCNSTSGGTYELTANQTLELLERGSSTMKGCAQDEDAFIARFLESSPQVEVEGHTITLTSPDGTVIEFLDENAPEVRPPLIGTRWALNSTTLPDGTGHGSISFQDIAFRFVDESTLEWFDGCVEVTTNVEVVFGSAHDPTADDVGELIFDSEGEARQGCGGVDARDIQEVTEALRGRTEFVIFGESLTIEAETGHAVILFPAE